MSPPANVLSKNALRMSPIQQPEPLLKMIYERDPSLAIQLWLENRPADWQITPTVTKSYEREAGDLALSPVINLDEPISAAILVRMLNNSDPRVRLEMTRALTQRGLSAVDALLDAAEDEHSLIRAVAKYALIHIGEGDYTSNLKRPMPPLFTVENQSFSFQSHGGCNAQVGPLRLIDVPNPTTVHLTLHIEHVDFDPFSAETFCKIEHTPPSILAAQLFEAMGNMDWMCVLAHYRFIAEQSVALVERVNQHKSLTDLSQELFKRSERYDCFGHHLADDLGLPYNPVVPNRSDLTTSYVKMNYRKLRRIYSYTNRSRLAEIPASKENATFTVNQTVDENTGTLSAIKADEIKLHTETGCALAGRTLLMSMDFGQNIENNHGGIWTGIDIDRMHSTAKPLPLLLRMSGSASIGNAVNSTLNGLFIHELIGGGWGWTTSLRINIGNFANSKLAGVVADRFLKYPSVG